MNLTVRFAFLGLCVGLSSLPCTLFAAEKAHLDSRVAATESVAFDVYVPIQRRDQLEKDLRAMHNPDSPTYQKWLTPAQFSAKYGATPAQLAAIKDQLTATGLEATIVSGHRIHVTGPGSMVERTLGTSLKSGTFQSGRHVVVATRAMTPPEAMTKVGANVVGLSGTIRMRTHSHSRILPDNRYASYGGYWFTDLKQAYSFPSYIGNTGKGATIATLTDGAYIKSDMRQYFGHEKMPVPKFSEVQVAGGSPVGQNTFETNLDMQQAGGIAPGAKIIHYNLPDLSDNSIIDGLSQIITENTVDIVSMSFGEPEIFYTAEYNDGIDMTYIPRIYDDLFAQGNAQGISFAASSGDAGALSAVSIECLYGGPSCGTAIASANFPASSPHVTGVGGTNLTTVHDGNSRNSAYVSEEAFGDPLEFDIFYGTSATGMYWGSGGGDSILFKKPSYQTLVDTGNKKYRTVPDLSFHMGGCPEGVFRQCNPADSFDYAIVEGESYGAIGTSASAPDMAGLAALAIERVGHRLGNVNYLIYKEGYLQSTGMNIKPFKKGIPGFNGKYFTSTKFYDRVLGLGTVNGVDLLLDPTGAVAGVPKTPSNP